MVTATPDQVKGWLTAVVDPEVPVLNIVEMGIVREVRVEQRGVVVRLTPTYSGCPALYAIEEAVEKCLADHGVDSACVETTYEEVWTTDWMSASAHAKLEEYGIAPPVRRGADVPVPCPFCKSLQTRLTSTFGSTACKAYHYCDSCEQPFEHFKCI